MILNATNKQQLYVIRAGHVAAYSVLIIFCGCKYMYSIVKSQINYEKNSIFTAKI